MNNEKSIKPADYADMKFGSFSIGDKIKAHNFEPMPFREDDYLEGIIEDAIEKNGAYFYKVLVTHDSHNPAAINDYRFVPIEIWMHDYDERITLIK